MRLENKMADMQKLIENLSGEINFTRQIDKYENSRSRETKRRYELLQDGDKIEGKRERECERTGEWG